MPDYPRSLKFVFHQLLDGQLEDVPMEHNSNQTKDAWRDYANWMIAGVQQNLIYLDEAAWFNLFTRCTRGRALIGQRAVQQVGGSKGQHLTLIMAISPGGGLVYFDLMFGGLTALLFDHFLGNLGDVIGEEIEVSVIMNNAPAHAWAEMEFNGH